MEAPTGRVYGCVLMPESLPLPDRHQPFSSTRRTTRRRKSHSRVVVFTGLDGPLVDEGTSDFRQARPMLRKLRAAGIPIVPFTRRTLAEVESLASELGVREAMIVEAGGGIARHTMMGWELEGCAPEAATLLNVIREIEERTGAELTVVSALPQDEARMISGLSGDALRRSTVRCYDEPFLILSGEFEEIGRAAAGLGFQLRHDGQFLHLRRSSDEGRALRQLREELRCEVAVAIGDSPIDAEVLTRAEIPIVLPRRNGTPDPELTARVPNARLAPAPGPAGWAAALEEVWPYLLAELDS